MAETRSKKRDLTIPDLPEADRLEGVTHPRAQTGLVGQADAERVLLDAYKSGRMHHAWLLSGPRGIGKATLAYRMAKFALHYGLPELVPDGLEDLSVPADSPAARQVTSLGHPDLLVIRRPYDDKAKRLRAVIPVEEARRLQPFFGKSAGAGGWRVCIVDAADELNTNAANALLKLLEEPPAKALFLIVSHQPGRLLPTIRSRCRKLTLKPLPSPAISSILAQEEVSLSPEDAEIIADLAAGSAGEALRLSAGGGIALYRELVALLAHLPEPDAPEMHKLADAASRRGADQTFETLTDLLLTFVQRLIATASGKPPAIEAAPHEAEIYRRLASPKGVPALDRWVEVWEKIAHSVARGEALNTDRKLVILTAFSLLEAVAAGRRLPV